MDFRQSALDKIIKKSVSGQLILLYFLNKTEEEVIADVQRGIRNVSMWLEMVFT
jgi:hypothetical protein